MSYWDSEYVDAHRRGMTDMEWADRQPQGSPKYKLGDVMEFKAGGYGVIVEVQHPHDGWPSEYATAYIEGAKDHPEKKRAWHYEGDFERCVARSPLHDPDLFNRS